jgi:aryl-phospho-beta-D-glucosidase BglC (GH1 family)
MKTPRFCVLLGLLLLSGFINGTAAGLSAPVPHWTLSGTSIKGPDGTTIHLHGFNVCWWVPPTDQDAADIQQLGANCVRYMFGYNPKGTYDPAQIDEVKRQIDSFTSRGIWVIPVLYVFEKPDPVDPTNPKKKLGPWSTPEMNQEFLALWTDVMGRLKGDPYVAAWEPINEPHDTPPATVAAWYRELIPKLRTIDPARPIVVEGANYSHAEDLTDEFKMDDANIIYAFHMYNPYSYTTDLQNPPQVYPGPWGRAYLEKTVQPALRFREKYQVPVWCGEWGVKTGAPSYQQWLRDTFAMMEADKFDWCIWAWALQPKDPQNQSFDINKQKTDVYHLMVDLFKNPSLRAEKTQPKLSR